MKREKGKGNKEIGPKPRGGGGVGKKKDLSGLSKEIPDI